MNYQKYITALLYSIQLPLSVWSGFELGVKNYAFGITLVAGIMIIEITAVVMWMNAQTIEIETETKKLLKTTGIKKTRTFKHRRVRL